MKKILLLLNFLILFSCSRNTDEPTLPTEPIKTEYFVRYKVNGTLTEKTFTAPSLFGEKIEQYISKSDPTIKGSIIILTSDWEYENALRFDDYNSNPAKNRYFFDWKTFTTTSGMTNFVFKYIDNGTKYIYVHQGNNDDSTFTMDIISTNNNTALGTFSGKLKASGVINGTSVEKIFTITEGNFKIPIINSNP